MKYYHQKDLVVSIKEPDNKDEFIDYLTEADQNAEKLIKKELGLLYPGYGFLGEESFEGKIFDEDFVWIVDPIDNTKGFVRKEGDFSVQIGLSYKGRGVLGVVYLPLQNKIYYAEKNSGAYCNGEQINVSEISDLVKASTKSSARIVDSKRLKELYDKIECKEKKILSGAGLKICLVGSGDIDFVIFKEDSAKEWDFCSPYVILKEAGGEMTLLDGSDLKFNKGISSYEQPVIISNGKIHEKLLEKLRE
jgi:3'(2'), 5'-bisphosphate nucleotidase